AGRAGRQVGPVAWSPRFQVFAFPFDLNYNFSIRSPAASVSRAGSPGIEDTPMSIPRDLSVEQIKQLPSSLLPALNGRAIRRLMRIHKAANTTS
ncbi:hypothetical protein RZS08_42340, partial [Arthrospira platensis SPKY1]|nr:hypothetical protein [Arthrospira platensis SPKY1]